MLRRGLLAGGAALPLAAWSNTSLAQAPGPPSLDEFFGQPTVVGAALSPSGDRIAVIRQRKEAEKWVGFVSLTSVASNLNAIHNVGLGAATVTGIQWKNDERLLVSLQFGSLLAYGGLVVFPVNRLGVLSADGKDFKLLFEDQPRLKENSPDLATVVDLLPNDPRNILMVLPDLSRAAAGLFKVDIYTGSMTLIERGSTSTITWFTQEGSPIIRVDRTRSGRMVTYLGRAPGETQWKTIRQVRYTEVERLKQDFDVLGPTPEPGVVLVSTMTEHDQTRTLRKYDVRTLGFGEVVSQRAGVDVIRCLNDVRGKYVAAVYQDDRLAYDFTDRGMLEHFNELETAFKNECNLSIVDMSADGNRWLVRVSGPREAGTLMFFDRAKGELGFVGVERPWLAAERLARVELLDVRSKDGTSLRAYLTVPLTNGPHPLVVLPHGGPEVRDVYDFDTFAQALAAQGWLVLQPNFRGSGGYGRAFADAGRRQFNGIVMEDIEATIDHVLASGRVDKGKVAICGMSFGGYAALMGAVRRPDAYRAVVSIAGVSDLQRAVESEREEPTAYEYWVRTAGDPKTDREMLAAASPLRRASEIKAPVMLIHGLLDQTVLPHQSKDMATALRRAGKTCEHVELPRAGHGGDAATSKEIITKTIAFLKPRLTV